jgi:hypothetical protein
MAADPPRSPDAGDDARERPDQGHPTGPSRWVVVVIIGLAIVLLGLIVYLHLSGAIGPGVH